MAPMRAQVIPAALLSLSCVYMCRCSSVVRNNGRCRGGPQALWPQRTLSALRVQVLLASSKIPPGFAVFLCDCKGVLAHSLCDSARCMYCTLFLLFQTCNYRAPSVKSAKNAWTISRYCVCFCACSLHHCIDFCL